MQGLSAHLPISRLLHPSQHLDARLTAMSDALRITSTEMYATRKYNRELLANQGIIEVGDSTVVKAQQALSLSSEWDPHWTVIAVNGKVVTLVHQQTNNRKVLNVNKVRVVDPNIAWDAFNPHPIRNSRVSKRCTRMDQQQTPTMLHIPPLPKSTRTNCKCKREAETSPPEILKPVDRYLINDHH